MNEPLTLLGSLVALSVIVAALIVAWAVLRAQGRAIQLSSHELLDKLADSVVDRVTEVLAKTETRMSDRLAAMEKRLGTFEDTINRDLETVHIRLEYLEQRERERPT